LHDVFSPQELDLSADVFEKESHESKSSSEKSSETAHQNSRIESDAEVKRPEKIGEEIMPEDGIIYLDDLSKLKRENLLRTMEIVRNGAKRFIERLNELLPALQATKKRLEMRRQEISATSGREHKRQKA